MFGLFGKKTTTPLSHRLTFDEAFCHSAGPAGRIYEIPKGTSEIVFAFGSFDAFWQRYVNQNMGLSNETLQALQDGQAMFIGAVADGGEYHCQTGVNDADCMVLNADTLAQMGADKPFGGFQGGSILFGIYHLGQFRTELLWATVYTTA